MPVQSLLIRPRQRADVLPLRLLMTRWQRVELPAPGDESSAVTGFILELDGKLVGQSVYRIQNYGARNSQCVVSGQGSWLDQDITRDPETLTTWIRATRHEVTRLLGLSQCVSRVPLSEFYNYHRFYSLESFVQQIASGAIDAPLVQAHLRLGARIERVQTSPLPFVELSWQNPVR